MTTQEQLTAVKAAKPALAAAGTEQKNQALLAMADALLAAFPRLDGVTVCLHKPTKRIWTPPGAPSAR